MDRLQYMWLLRTYAEERWKPLASWTHERVAENPSCGDRLRLQFDVQDGSIVAVGMEARGCLLSRASAAVLLEHVLGCPMEGVGEVVSGGLEQLLEPGKKAEEAFCMLREGLRLPVRRRCVLLPWYTLVRNPL